MVALVAGPRCRRRGQEPGEAATVQSPREMPYALFLSPDLLAITT